MGWNMHFSDIINVYIENRSIKDIIMDLQVEQNKGVISEVLKKLVRMPSFWEYIKANYNNTPSSMDDSWIGKRHISTRTESRECVDNRLHYFFEYKDVDYNELKESFCVAISKDEYPDFYVLFINNTLKVSSPKAYMSQMYSYISHDERDTRNEKYMNSLFMKMTFEEIKKKRSTTCTIERFHMESEPTEFASVCHSYLYSLLHPYDARKNHVGVMFEEIEELFKNILESGKLKLRIKPPFLISIDYHYEKKRSISQLIDFIEPYYGKNITIDISLMSDHMYNALTINDVVYIFTRPFINFDAFDITTKKTVLSFIDNKIKYESRGRDENEHMTEETKKLLTFFDIYRI